MDCREFGESVNDYIDDELSFDARARLGRHAEECPQCALKLEQMQSLMGFLDEMPLSRASAGFVERTIGRLKEAGLIVEAPAAPYFGGMTGRIKAVLAMVTLCAIAVVMFPATIGSLKGIVGGGTVLATDAYIEIQETASNADALTRIAGGVERILKAALTVATAALALLARASDLLLLPALGTMLVLTMVTFFFMRLVRRRDAEHALFSL
jgi:hypothetical protein